RFQQERVRTPGPARRSDAGRRCPPGRVRRIRLGPAAPEPRRARRTWLVACNRNGPFGRGRRDRAGADMRETRAARADRRAASLLQIVLLACAVACAARSPAEEAFPSLATYEGWEITAVRFAGGEPFSLDTLANLTETEPTRANLLGLPIHIFGLGLEREYLE